MMKDQPSPKGGDTDVREPMLRLSSAVVGAARCGCACACCVGGHVATPDHRGAPTERLLHHEPRRVAVGALERRRALIAEVLLPRAKELSAALVKANEGGLIGAGELDLVCTLQAWVHQLQVEEEELRLVLSPPQAEPKAT